jgi:hypothetical protein
VRLSGPEVAISVDPYSATSLRERVLFAQIGRSVGTVDGPVLESAASSGTRFVSVSGGHPPALGPCSELSTLS